MHVYLFCYRPYKRWLILYHTRNAKGWHLCLLFKLLQTIYMLIFFCYTCTFCQRPPNDDWFCIILEMPKGWHLSLLKLPPLCMLIFVTFFYKPPKWWLFLLSLLEMPKGIKHDIYTHLDSLFVDGVCEMNGRVTTPAVNVFTRFCFT